MWASVQSRAYTMAYLAGSSIGGLRRSMKNWPARMQHFAQGGHALLPIIFQILQTTILYRHASSIIRIPKETTTLSFMQAAEMAFSQEWVPLHRTDGSD